MWILKFKKKDKFSFVKCIFEVWLIFMHTHSKWQKWRALPQKLLFGLVIYSAWVKEHWGWLKEGWKETLYRSSSLLSFYVTIWINYQIKKYIIFQFFCLHKIKKRPLFLYIIHFAGLSVCLYSLNVKSAKPIGTKNFEATHMTPWNLGTFINKYFSP